MRPHVDPPAALSQDQSSLLRYPFRIIELPLPVFLFHAFSCTRSVSASIHLQSSPKTSSNVSVRFVVCPLYLEMHQFDVWIFVPLQHSVMYWAAPLLVRCHFRCQSNHLNWGPTRSFPSRHTPSILPWCSRPTLATPQSTLGDAPQPCSCPIVVTNKDPAGHATGQNVLTPSSPALRKHTFSPNCAIGFLQLCLAIFAQFHCTNEWDFKAWKRAEQRILVRDACCRLLLW